MGEKGCCQDCSGAEVENWILVDRLVRDWVIVAEEKDSSGAETGNWLPVDRLMRDWVTVVEEKDCCKDFLCVIFYISILIHA